MERFHDTGSLHSLHSALSLYARVFESLYAPLVRNESLEAGAELQSMMNAAKGDLSHFRDLLMQTLLWKYPVLVAAENHSLAQEANESVIFDNEAIAATVADMYGLQHREADQKMARALLVLRDLPMATFGVAPQFQLHLHDVARGGVGDGEEGYGGGAREGGGGGRGAGGAGGGRGGGGYATAIYIMENFHRFLSPTRMLHVLVSVCAEICKCIAEWNEALDAAAEAAAAQKAAALQQDRSSSPSSSPSSLPSSSSPSSSSNARKAPQVAIGAEDLIPIFSYVLAQAASKRQPTAATTAPPATTTTTTAAAPATAPSQPSFQDTVVSQCMMLNDFIPDSAILGAGGYCLATLQTAIQHITELGEVECGRLQEENRAAHRAKSMCGGGGGGAGGEGGAGGGVDEKDAGEDGEVRGVGGGVEGT